METTLRPILSPELAAMGWTPELAAQVGANETALRPARLASVHRRTVEAITVGGGRHELVLPPSLPMGNLAVGDWVLADDLRVHRLLDRSSLLHRFAAGSGVARQLIAANIDTLLIVTSCNADFNEARLERYLVLAGAAGITPVIVLTKADLGDPAGYVARARGLQRDLAVVALNAKGADVADRLAEWLQPGRTLALLGSSGVGKSTIANALGAPLQDTGEIREDDAKGRHTTTARHLLPLPGQAWLIDTPGVRELQLTDMAAGLEVLYADLIEIGAGCRFRNCTHDHEPGCALRAAAEAGQIDPARLVRWRKLALEDATNSTALERSATRSAGKHTRKSATKLRPPDKNQS